MTNVERCFFIGTDEAGYGPNFGPLVVSATLWQGSWDHSSFFSNLPEQAEKQSKSPYFDLLIQKLNSAAEQTQLSKKEFRLDDSKKIYHSQGTLSLLENSLLTILFGLWKSSIDSLSEKLDEQTAPKKQKSSKNLEHSAENWTIQSLIDRLCGQKINSRTDVLKICSPKFPQKTSATAFSEKNEDSEKKAARPVQQMLFDFGKEKTPKNSSGDSQWSAWNKRFFQEHQIPFDSSSKSQEEIQQLSEQLFSSWDKQNIRLLDARSRMMFPDEFNQQLDSGKNKSQILADATFTLVASMIDQIFWTSFQQKFDTSELAHLELTHSEFILPELECSDLTNDEPEIFPICIFCDKLGGRNSYSELIEEFFPSSQPEILEESRAVSRYCFSLSLRQTSYFKQLKELPLFRNYAGQNLSEKKPAGDHLSGQDLTEQKLSVLPDFLCQTVPVYLVFQAKGEQNKPAALASMICKYLRELSMFSFNQFWQSLYKTGTLRPTAGYPQDAKRFWKEVESLRNQYHFSDSVFWRKK